MKIQLISDLHLEFLNDHGKALAKRIATDADILVIAGDLVPLKTIDVAERFFKIVCDRHKHVVYVPGNHEYYQSNPQTIEENIDKLNVKFINLFTLDADGVLVLDGQRFLGGTLWFPKTTGDDKYKKYMTDFRIIKGFDPWVYEANQACVTFIDNELQEGDIVVTHHLPSDMSVDKIYKGDQLNRFFVCDLEWLIQDRKPKLWFHGHTHLPCDYKLGDTRVVCNPKGYPHEVGPTFNERLIIEV